MNFLLASCPYKGCPTSAAFNTENFSIIDLKCHLAIQSPTCRGLLDGLQGVALVQGINKIEVLPFFQEAAVGGNLSLQLDLDVQQGLILRAWH